MKVRHLALAGLAIAGCLSIAVGRTRAPEQQRTPLDVAREYLAAYEALDWSRMAALTTDALTWQDPTSAQIGADGSRIEGREAVLAHLQGATAGIVEMDFEFTKTFHSAGVVVNVGTFSYTMPHVDPARAGESMRFEIDTVIVLELDGERVRSHTDYADFEAWTEQYREQI